MIILALASILVSALIVAIGMARPACRTSHVRRGDPRFLIAHRFDDEVATLHNPPRGERT